MTAPSDLFGRLVVVETDRDAYIGTLEMQPDGKVAVCTGLAGRRPVLSFDDIDEVHDAMTHPDVVVLAARGR